MLPCIEFAEVGAPKAGGPGGAVAAPKAGGPAGEGPAPKLPGGPTGVGPEG